MKNLKYLLISLCFHGIIYTGCDTKVEEPVKKDTTVIIPPAVPPFMADTIPLNRVAVLEDFTGVRCQYCPDGHVKAKAEATANPGKFIIIAVHAGPYASPATGWANFTTAFGGSLIAQSNVTGYPSGTVSRILCSQLGVPPQSAGGYAMSRGSWAAAANKVYTMSAPVNLGAKATFDPLTRLLTIKVDIYYTAEETVTNNLNIAILQDGLKSKQSGTTQNPYIQDNVLRDFVTGQWGEVIKESKAKGSKISKTYTYTLPENYNGLGVEGGGAVIVEDLSIVAFISQGKTKILNAIEVEVK